MLFSWDSLLHVLSEFTPLHEDAPSTLRVGLPTLNNLINKTLTGVLRVFHLLVDPQSSQIDYTKTKHHEDRNQKLQ